MSQVEPKSLSTEQQLAILKVLRDLDSQLEGQELADARLEILSSLLRSGVSKWEAFSLVVTHNDLEQELPAVDKESTNGTTTQSKH